MFNLYSLLFYKFIKEDIEKLKLSNKLIDIAKRKKEIISKISVNSNNIHPLVLSTSNQLEEYLKIYKQLNKETKIYKFVIKSKFPGAFISIGNYVLPWFENGFIFDIFSNSPLIPESEIKGVVLRAIIAKYYQNLQNIINKTELDLTKLNERLYAELLKRNRDILTIFRVTFISQYLGTEKDSKNIFEIDVLTPHGLSSEIKRIDNKTKYEIENMIEYVNPVPIFLIKLKENVKFVVYLIVKQLQIPTKYLIKDSKIRLKINDTLGLLLSYLEVNNKLEEWKEILDYALGVLGIGSKTTYGYGRFEIESYEEL